MCEICFRSDKFLSEYVLQHTCKLNAFSNRFLRKLKTLLNEYRTLLIINKIVQNSTPTPLTWTPANSNYLSFPLRVRVSGVLLYNILYFPSRSVFLSNKIIFSSAINRNYENQNLQPTKLWKVFVRVHSVGVSTKVILKTTRWPIIIRTTYVNHVPLLSSQDSFGLLILRPLSAFMFLRELWNQEKSFTW